MRIIIHPARYRIGDKSQNQRGDGMVDLGVTDNGCDFQWLHTHNGVPVWSSSDILEQACVCTLCIVPLKEPAEWFETKQRATGHLVGAQCPDDMLVHCQDVAQAAVEWTLLIDRSAARRLIDKLHHIDADADDVRKGGG